MRQGLHTNSSYQLCERKKPVSLPKFPATKSLAAAIFKSGCSSPAPRQAQRQQHRQQQAPTHDVACGACTDGSLLLGSWLMRLATCVSHQTFTAYQFSEPSASGGFPQTQSLAFCRYLSSMNDAVRNGRRAALLFSECATAETLWRPVM